MANPGCISILHKGVKLTSRPVGVVSCDGGAVEFLRPYIFAYVPPYCAPFVVAFFLFSIHLQYAYHGAAIHE